MHPLQPNPETGFLESINPITTEGFTSAKKVKFLELATEIANRHEYPDIVRLCDQVGTKYRTFALHVEQDEVFREAWNELKSRLFSGFTNELSIKAKSNNGIIANLAVLKYLESGSFLDQQRIMINADFAPVKAISQTANQIIEAELVTEKGKLSSPDQVLEK